MAETFTDDTALDLTGSEHFQQDRHSVVQPDPEADDTAISFASTVPAASPRCKISELVQQAWSDADTDHWRRATR